MARKSRKKFNTSVMLADIPAQKRKWNVGIYIRLSVEDNGRDKKDSVENQLLYLQGFAQEHDKELEIREIYIDNGTTGTNFEREGWKRMLEDIKSGKINSILVKDFSRMGRNYIEVGNYLEKIFPFLNVRVISVNDNFDSLRDEYQESMLINSLANIVNEYYARDISRKITQTKRTMQRKGEYASGVLPYGYKRDESNYKSFAPDPEASCIVKKIYEWRVQGKGCVCIAGYLNELAVPSPGQYRYMEGNRAFKRSQNVKWKSKHVSGILKNPVYLGHMIQGKTHTSYFENEGKACQIPESEWIITENAFEAIITEEQFQIASEMAKKSEKQYHEKVTANADIPKVENILRKKIYCGQCRRKMTRRCRVEEKTRRYFYFCTTSQNIWNTRCTDTHINEELLMNKVRTVTNQQLQLIGNVQNKWLRERELKQSELSMQQKREKLSKLKKKILQNKGKKKELYENMLERKITYQAFQEQWQGLVQQAEDYEKLYYELKQSYEKEKYDENKVNKYRQEIRENEIPIKLLDHLIRKIIVYSSDRIEIVYDFENVIPEGWRED